MDICGASLAESGQRKSEHQMVLSEEQHQQFVKEKKCILCSETRNQPPRHGNTTEGDLSKVLLRVEMCK
ncbi:hypothetical protein MRB53_007631 [Persea americana]|uniref:Uncharacterized protein n=1 Tax=Persea americana TaxID=3435 RepID=A0ACC2MKI8_PERAE|nr:hypothetical protein MRB53_007631 [Persea americana]